MTSHELAQFLLTQPDLPIAVSSGNHQWIQNADELVLGGLKIGVLESYAGQHIIIGNWYHHDLNRPNWYISQDLYLTPSTPQPLSQQAEEQRASEPLAP